MRCISTAIISIFLLAGAIGAHLLIHHLLESEPKDNQPISFQTVKQIPPLQTGPFGSALRLRQDEDSLSSRLLSREISFQGLNKRPDAKKEELFLKLRSSQEVFKISIGKIAYLKEERTSSAWQWSTEKTPLFLIVEKANHEQASISIYLNQKSPYKNKVVERLDLSLNSYDSEQFLNSIKHDLKWCGNDLFIQDHGASLKQREGKEKIHYMGHTSPKFIQAAFGECFIWKADTWIPVKNYEDSREHYLLECLGSKEDLLILKLWSPISSRSIEVSLSKTFQDTNALKSIKENLSFLSIKTPQKLLFIYASQAFYVSPGDWFLVKPSSLEKISDKKTLNLFLAGELAYPLVIFDQLGRKKGRYFMKGHAYNVTRTEKISFEIPMKEKKHPNIAMHIPKSRTKKGHYEHTL